MKTKDSELFCLYCAIEKEESLSKVIKELSESHFTIDTTVKMFNFIKKAYGEKLRLDITIVSNSVNDDKAALLLMQASELIISHSSLDSHIAILKEALIRKSIFQLGHQLISLSSNEEKESLEIISEASASLNKIMLDNESTEEYDHFKSVSEWFVNVTKNMNQTGAIKGFRSNWPLLDYYTSGFQRGRNYIIGGLKKTGKSRFVLDLTSHFLLDTLGGIVFSMEMTPDQIHTCIIGNRTLINTKTIGTSEMIETDHAKLINATGKYSNEALSINKKSRITPEYVRSIISLRKRFHRVDFVVIDYIQRMQAHGFKSKADELEYISTSLADIGRDEDVCMIVLSQLSGDAEKEKHDGRSIHSFVKGSQAIIEAADCAIMLKDPNRGKQDEFGEKDSKIIEAYLLQRDGESDIKIDMTAMLQFSKFETQRKDK